MHISHVKCDFVSNRRQIKVSHLRCFWVQLCPDIPLPQCCCRCMLSQRDPGGESEGLMQPCSETAGNLSPGNWVNAEQASGTEEVKLND